MRSKKLIVQIVSRAPYVEDKIFTDYSLFIGNLFTYYLPPVYIRKLSKLLIDFKGQDDCCIFPQAAGESIHELRTSFSFDRFFETSPPADRNCYSTPLELVY